MPLQSDLTLSAALFDPANVDGKTSTMNKKLMEITAAGPTWVEVGAPAYRQMRLDGKTALPKPTILPAGRSFDIPSREAGRSIPCRLFYPSSQAEEKQPKTKGVIMHIHGGGWVLMSHETSDPLLQLYANESGCATLSVGYRLAPEDPFPAGPEDCYDAGEWLVDHAQEVFGGPLRFIGGESAGGHLSLLTSYHLLRTRSSHALNGLLLHFGAFDLSLLPGARSFPHQLVLTKVSMENFFSAFIPTIYPSSLDGLKDPAVSPFYEDLEKFRGRLPPALFTCGTMDALLEDSIMMAAKYAMAGGEQVLKVVEGGCHGYIAFDPKGYPAAQIGRDATASFIKETMRGELELRERRLSICVTRSLK